MDRSKQRGRLEWGDTLNSSGATSPSTNVQEMVDSSSVATFTRSLREVRLSVVLFTMALIMPTYTSFVIGSMRLNLCRILLIVMIVPSMVGLFGGGRKILTADLLILFGGLWAAATLTYHHGLGSGVETGGIFLLESVGAYALGRTVVTSAREYSSLVALLTTVVIVLMPCVVLESLTNFNIFGLTRIEVDMRMGLFRARGPFDHPILFGVFCASVLGLSWFAFPRCDRPVGFARIFRAGLVVLTAGMSVSTGPLAAITVQLLLVAWNYVASRMRSQWKLLCLLLVSGYIFIDVLSSRTPLKVFLTYLTFSSETAYYRLNIWDAGFYDNVLVSPMIGIGLQDWVRPDWMHSSSIDNFWLVLMIRHGLPCFVAIAVGGLYLMYAGARGAKWIGLEVMHKGWVISMIGVAVAACTVHFWNSLFVYFFFLLGAGAWFCNPQMGREYNDG